MRVRNQGKGEAVLTHAGAAAWTVAVAAAFFLFWSPVIAAARRRAQGISLVLMLTICGLPTAGVTWLVAWYMALTMPTRAPAAPYQAGRPLR
jgi:hypothetical protein